LVGSAELASLAEAALSGVEVSDAEISAELAPCFVGDGDLARTDTVVLACTHYPLLKPLAQRLLGTGVVLVDSAQNAAATLARKLAGDELKRSSPAQAGQITICATDLPAQFSRLAERFLGEKIKAIEQVAVG
jgi:glutamate racemase